MFLASLVFNSSKFRLPACANIQIQLYLACNLRFGLSRLLSAVLRRSNQLVRVLYNESVLTVNFAIFIDALGSLIALSRAPPSAQAKVDYKAVPILQPMKEVAPTPEINLATPDGKKISLKDFRGKVVMLNFWASWCVPAAKRCRRWKSSIKNLRIRILSSSGSRSKTANKTPSISSRSSSSAIQSLSIRRESRQEYGAWGLPATYFIGPKGEGLARGWGPADGMTTAREN